MACFAANASVLSCGDRWNMASLKAALPSVSHPSSSALAFRYPVAATRAFTCPGARLSRAKSSSMNKSAFVFRSFTGLANQHQFPCTLPESTSYESSFSTIDNGGRVIAMRHGKRVPKLNRPPDQRKALLRGLTTQLLKYGRIKTTQTRAKAMRKYVEKMITLAKDGSLHKRRQALGFIYEKEIVHALFAEVPERYGEREGGYTRIIRTLPRRGDNAPMAYIELV